MKKTKTLPEAPGVFSGNGAKRITTKAGGPVRNSAGRVFKHPKSELEAAIQRYVDLFEFAPIPYVSFDRVGHIEEVNRAAVELLGASRNRLIGGPFALHVTKEDAGLFLDHLLHCRASDIRVETELHLKKRNGEVILVHLASWPAASLMRDGALLYQTAIVDLSELKRAEEALHQSEERMRAIVEQATVGMARADRDGRLLFVNEAFCQMLGYKESELIGKLISAFTHKDEVKTSSALFRRLIKHGEAYELEKRYIRKNGSVLWVNVSAAPVRDPEGNPRSAVAVVVDMTERKNAEAALKRSRAQLEELVQKRTQALREANRELQNEIQRRKGLEGEILSISDREQQRLGEELHDGLCQQLAAIGLMTRATALRLKNHRVIQVEDLENITRLINDSAISARKLARDLHRDEIDAAGFLQALQDLVRRKIWTTPCRLELRSSVHLSDDKAAAQLYRILREAVVNAHKHSQATEIVLEVARSNGELAFSVTDNGTGFNSKARRGLGLGFHIMKHRAQSIGARLEFESPRRGGARVVCRLPQRNEGASIN